MMEERRTKQFSCGFIRTRKLLKTSHAVVQLPLWDFVTGLLLPPQYFVTEQSLPDLQLGLLMPTWTLQQGLQQLFNIESTHQTS